MPIISMFYGIIIQMYFDDHNPPHFHAKYQDEKAIFDLEGDIISGKLPKKQMHMVQVWAEIHHDELVANWEMASEEGSESIMKITPLR